MGVASGCGCKEVYRFPHITYPYSSCICSFLQQHPTFCSFLKMLYIYIYTVYRVSYRGGGALGYPPPRSSFPPPKNFISHYTPHTSNTLMDDNILGWWPPHLATTQNASESTSENVKIKNFLGGHAPRPP